MMAQVAEAVMAVAAAVGGCAVVAGIMCRVRNRQIADQVLARLAKYGGRRI